MRLPGGRRGVRRRATGRAESRRTFRGETRTGTSDDRTLYFRGNPIKTYKAGAAHRQVEDSGDVRREGWPSVIPETVQRSALAGPNAPRPEPSLCRSHTIRFGGDGSGGVRSEPMDHHGKFLPVRSQIVFCTLAWTCTASALLRSLRGSSYAGRSAVPKEILSFTAAAKKLPRLRANRPVHPSTIWRWATCGIRGIRLETTRLGGITVTLCGGTKAYFLPRWAGAGLSPGPAALAGSRRGADGPHRHLRGPAVTDIPLSPDDDRDDDPPDLARRRAEAQLQAREHERLSAARGAGYHDGDDLEAVEPAGGPRMTTAPPNGRWVPPDCRAAAAAYLKHGVLPIPLHHEGQETHGRRPGRSSGRPPRTSTRLFPPRQTCNVGLLLGKPSGLIDVDLDGGRGDCRRTFLPPADQGWISGRCSARSHPLVSVRAIPRTKRPTPSRD